MNDIMIDLETLGTGDNAAIIQIGAVRFDPNEDLDSRDRARFQENIRWSCAGFGEIEPDTVLWWNQQDPGVRARVYEQKDALPLRDAIGKFHEWAHYHIPIGNIWANSPDFDLRLLRQACSRFAYVPYPFEFRNHRDMRTLVKELGVPEDEPKFIGFEHDALDDAIHQAYWVVNIMKRIGKP